MTNENEGNKNSSKQNYSRYNSLKELVEEYHYISIPVKTELGEMNVPLNYPDFTNYLFSEDKGCQYFPNGKIYIFSARDYLQNEH